MGRAEFFRVKDIIGLKPPANGGFMEASDSNKETKALRVRVSAASTIFYMSARWQKGASSATSRAIGLFTEEEREERDDDGDKVFLTLAEARDKVREWDRLRRGGVDPAARRAAERAAREAADREAAAAAEAARAGVFRAVVEAYIASPDFRKHKRAEKSEKAIRRELLDAKRNKWVDRPISEIDDEDVVALIVAIRDRKIAYSTGRKQEGAPAVAVNTFDHLRAIFEWAMRPERRKSFGLRFNPVAHLRIKDFGIMRNVRQTVLTPDEIRAFWQASGKMGYPWGHMFRMLLVTGQRLNEIARASWPEFDLAEKLLVIPPERFKSNATHPVPLSDLALEIVAELPRREDGPYAFSVKRGRSPATAIGVKKAELDRLMLIEMKTIARERGEPEPDKLRPFVLHDLRRVVRSSLSSLRVPDVVAELTIGHGKKGLARVYDQHHYLPEMRDALQAWADRLRITVNPPSGTNVVLMRKIS